MKEMGLTEHLEELRTTLVRVAIILSLSFFICYSFGDVISEFLLHPLRETLGKDSMGEIVYFSVLDKMLSQIQVSFWTCIILSSPAWFFEIWRFVRPALYEHEVKAVRPFILAGFVFFIAGVAFAYYIAYPLTFQALMQVGVTDVKAMIGLKEYLVLTSQVLVLMGVMFQLPNVLLILALMGVVTKYSLRNMRRYIYLGLAVFAAIVTPPDVITMLALWIPLMLLFEVGILAVAFIAHPYLARKHA